MVARDLTGAGSRRSTRDQARGPMNRSGARAARRKRRAWSLRISGGSAPSPLAAGRARAACRWITQFATPPCRLCASMMPITPKRAGDADLARGLAGWWRDRSRSAGSRSSPRALHRAALHRGALHRSSAAHGTAGGTRRSPAQPASATGRRAPSSARAATAPAACAPAREASEGAASWEPVGRPVRRGTRAAPRRRAPAPDYLVVFPNANQRPGGGESAPPPGPRCGPAPWGVGATCSAW
jgi:hypothetical protein